MGDTLTPEERSERMRLVRGKDTKPELTVRKLLFSLGYRYRLHVVSLPGRPDIVFPGRHKAIFVHGCFWHRHKNCRLARYPKSKLDYWRPKLDANDARDRKNIRELKKLGWRVCIVWECQVRSEKVLWRRLVRFLDGQPDGTGPRSLRVRKR